MKVIINFYLPMSIFEKLRKLDCFTSKLELNLKGQKEFSNHLSISFSLVYWLIIIFLISYNLYKFIAFNNTNVFLVTSQLDVSKFFEFKPEDLNITFLTVNSKFMPYSIKPKGPIIQSEVVVDESTSFNKVGSLSQCSEENNPAPSGSNSAFLWKSAKCAIFDKSFEVGGSILQSKSQKALSLGFNLDLCEDKGVDCSKVNSTEELIKMNDIIFVLGYQTFVPATNISEGFKQNIYTKELTISPFYDYIITLKATKMSVSTDPNVIFYFLDDNQVEFISVTSVEVTDAVRKDPRFTSIELTVEMEYDEIQLNRSYSKIDDILANIQAVSDLTSMILGLIAAYFTNGLIEKEVVESCYFVKGKGKRKPSHFIAQRESSNQEVVIKEEKLKLATIEMSILDSIKIGFGIKPSVLVENGFSLVEKDFDFIEIIKKNLILETLIENNFSCLDVETLQENQKRDLVPEPLLVQMQDN